VQRAASGDPILRAGGLALRYRDEGAGPAVVLLHGWALTLEQFDAQAAALARSFRVVRFDRPGFGDSTGAPGTIPDLLALQALRRYLGLERCAVLGASQGARAALLFALQEADALTALVLDGAPLEGFEPGPRPEDTVSVAELTELRAAAGMPAVRAALLAHPFFALRGDGTARETLEAMLARYEGTDLRPPASTPAGFAATVGWNPGVLDGSVAASLGRLRVPVLVLNGEHDTRHRRLVGDALAYGLPHAERRVLAGAGHLANLDRPAEYTAAVTDFLLRHIAPR